MLRLDPVTVSIMLGLMSLLCAAFLVVIRLFFPNSVKGLNSWVLASMLYVVSGLMHGLKEDHATLILTVLANSFLVAGLLLFLRGLQEFYNRPPLAAPPFWGVVLLVALAIAWFTIHDSFHMRIIVMTCTLSALFCVLARFVYRHGRDSFGDWLMISAFVVAGVISMVRLFSELVSPNSVDSLFDVTILHITYLSSFSFAWLLSTLGFIALVSDELQSQLHYLARHDAMTGALNRVTLFQEAAARFKAARKAGRPIAVLILDIDHFKAINDNYGHQDGDRVLVQFCGIIQSSLEQSALFGRYGGEEFVLLLDGVSGQEALGHAQQLREAVSRGLASQRVTVSVGVAADSSAQSIDDLIAQADKALYQAKRDGRNRAVLHSPQSQYDAASLPAALSAQPQG